MLSKNQNNSILIFSILAHTAPFKMHVEFDDGELVLDTGGDTTTCETCPATATQQSGADGFYLEYFQMSC